MNPLFNMNGNPMMQAVMSMMRGESPQQFLQSLAKSNPQLQGLDLSNLEQTAKTLCNKKGVDVNEAITKVSDTVKTMK
jgi:hypothetical protein